MKNTISSVRTVGAVAYLKSYRKQMPILRGEASYVVPQLARSQRSSRDKASGVFTTNSPGLRMMAMRLLFVRQGPRYSIRRSESNSFAVELLTSGGVPGGLEPGTGTTTSKLGCSDCGHVKAPQRQKRALRVKPSLDDKRTLCEETGQKRESGKSGESEKG